MALSNMFNGAATTDTTSSSESLEAGDYVICVSGVLDGAVVVLEGNVFDSDFSPIDGQLDMYNAGFRAFRMCDCNIRAVLQNAGVNTSVKVAILAAQ